MFYNCKGLKNINIPPTVQKICTEAFYECSSLEQIDIPNSVTTIQWRAFSRCNNANATIHNKRSNVYIDSHEAQFKSITFTEQ